MRDFYFIVSSQYAWHYRPLKEFFFGGVGGEGGKYSLLAIINDFIFT